MSDFKFHIPVDIQKSEDGEMRIGGIASTETKDLQGEIVKASGLDLSELHNGRGIFNDDHGKGVENVVGLIDFAKAKEGKGMYVEGTLLPNDKAKNYYNIMTHCKKHNKPNRVHMSIEGSIQERSGDENSIITKAKITKVALTLDPVNRQTYAELLKSLSIKGDKEIEVVGKSYAGETAEVEKAQPKLNKEEMIEVFDRRLKQSLKWGVQRALDKGETDDEKLKECVVDYIYDDILSGISYDENLLAGKRARGFDYDEAKKYVNSMDLGKIKEEYQTINNAYSTGQPILALSQRIAEKGKERVEQILKARTPGAKDKQERKKKTGLGFVYHEQDLNREPESRKHALGHAAQHLEAAKYYKQSGDKDLEGFHTSEAKRKGKLFSKALTTEGNAADTLPEDRKGGAALMVEDLESDKKKKKVKEIVKGILKRYPSTEKKLDLLVKKACGLVYK